MRYRYEVGEPDSNGNRPVAAYEGEHLVMTGVLTPQRVTVTPAMVVNYQAHRDIDEGVDAAEELATWVNALAGGGR